MAFCSLLLASSYNSSATCSLHFFYSLLTGFSLSSSLRFFLSIDILASFRSLASYSPRWSFSLCSFCVLHFLLLYFMGFVHLKQICKPTSSIGIAWAWPCPVTLTASLVVCLIWQQSTFIVDNFLFVERECSTSAWPWARHREAFVSLGRIVVLFNL